MDVAQLRHGIAHGQYDNTFQWLYGDKAVHQRLRYDEAVEQFAHYFGTQRQVRLFSAPGRTEVAGNHTDHQHGRVMAASVNMDMLAVASENGENLVRIRSQGYPEIQVDLQQLDIVPAEEGTSTALVRGVAARLKMLGYRVGGLDAYTTSTVLKGSGLSSSAAFEVLIGVLFNQLYNEGRASAVELAQIGQYAENVYFGKPCGLMDQMASSVGGLITIDFADPATPVIQQIPEQLDQLGYAICVTDTGGNHADLTPEYGAIPYECGLVAKAFGKEVLRDVDADAFFARLGELRESLPQRALLRAIHIFEENQRVPLMAKALAEGDMETFLRLEIESGLSSLAQLQNVYPASFPQEQGVNLGLTMSRRILAGAGSYRVHGGGFAGTMQAFVPKSLLEDYVQRMEQVFGKDHCHVLYLRPVGGTEVLPQSKTER